ncbi:MAG: hypothetical protein RR954_03830 [Christensenellaceae bacterium]
MKDINFFTSIKQNKPKKKINPLVRNGIIISCICALVVVGSYVFMTMKTSNVKAAVAQLEDKYNESESAKQLHDFEAKQEELMQLSDYVMHANALTKAIDAYPKIDEAFLKAVASKMPEDVKVVTTQYTQGVFTLQCISKNALSPATFAAALREIEGVLDVQYPGYAMVNVDAAPIEKPQIPQIDAGQEQAAKKPEPKESAKPTQQPQTQTDISFTVSCILKGGEAK